ncbi:MAG: alpha/beta fold hydrolase [Phycisphaerae bacterium]|nr:alpha/beta fold hydrolase [Phycisphaerae bacterium]
MSALKGRARMRIKLLLSAGAMGLLLSGCLGATNRQVGGPDAAKSAAAEKRTLVWDTAALSAVPKVYATKKCPAPPMRAFFYEGADYKGQPTHVFAYYAAPEGKAPAGGWPAVVCAHGGGGTAYPDWVKQWNKYGYAAISMDLEGHLPDKRAHKNAGPARRNWFSDIGLPDKEQWFYHAVADVIRANSLLRSFKEINPRKIGLAGISWGGTIAATVAGVDSRFAFVVPIYGCGFLHESDNEGITQWFSRKNMTPAQYLDYRTKWDPAAHLCYAKMPMYWVNGSNDGTFPMDIFQRSALATAGPSLLHVRFRWMHGHSPGWRRRDVYAFTGSIVKGAPPLPTAARPTLEAKTRRVSTRTTGKIFRAALCYTTGGGKWQRRYWENAACEIGEKEVTSVLPKGATVFYFNVKDKDGNLVSSEFVEIKNP